MHSILRAKQVYGRGNPIPVGHSKFYKDFVEHDPADPFVPNTNNTVRRLKAVPLGERAKGFFSDKIEELLEGLRRLSVLPRRAPGPTDHAESRRRRVALLEMKSAPAAEAVR